MYFPKSITLCFPHWNFLGPFVPLSRCLELPFLLHSLELWFSILTIDWNHLGRFKKYLCLHSTPRNSDLIVLGCGSDIGILKISPSASNVQPELRTTALDVLLLSARFGANSLCIIWELVRNGDTRTPPRPTESNLHINKIDLA